MAVTNGAELVARALRRQGAEVFFFILGVPMMDTHVACVEAGLRAIDVRHEQAAAMMANAYARLLNRPGLCMAASGPGTTNLVTGVANAFIDGAPAVALGGAAPMSSWGREAFQELDQVPIFKPITKWAERVYSTNRIPDMIDSAFRQAISGKPGPVYLDLPADVLHAETEESSLRLPEEAPTVTRSRVRGDPDLVKAAVRLLSEAKRPLVLTGSGVLWSRATEALQRFVETAGIPFYTTPQGRGILPDDHSLAFLSARSTALREADCLLVVGTRFNYILNYGQAPTLSPAAKLIRVDVDPTEVGRNRNAEVGIVGDAGAALEQLARVGEGILVPELYADWVERLRQVNARRSQEQEALMSTDQLPIHPLRLCKEVRDFLDRDAILVVDGQEMLNYGRQSIPTFAPGHRLNSGPAGCMGVGLPFGLGAKVAKPEKQVMVLHGDGSFGLNAMELDTAVRHKLAVVTVISNNGGWTAREEGKLKVGRELGFTRYDLMAQGLGCHGEFVERPEDIRPALERAYSSGVPAVVNVITDPYARASKRKFVDYKGYAV